MFWLWESKGNFAFKKARKNLLFQKQANFKGEAFWLPLQPWFAKDTAFFSAKAQNSGIRRSRILGQYAGSRFGTRRAVSEFSVSGIRGFGLRLLVRQGFLGAEAPLEPAICVRIQRKLDSGALAHGF